ncbi:MAG: acetylornithine transaminase [Campylobacterales bacterium]|nr:acetylornithine transaminase [Campylobacterales bacterium]
MLKSQFDAFVLPTYARAEVSFVSGENATLLDDTGKDYIDFTSGIGVVSMGHGKNALSEALCTQLQRITHISNLFLIAPQAEAAELIVKASGYDMACFFGNSGAEANEGAIKLARKYGEQGEKKRYKIITLDHSFHGRTITTVKATGQSSMHHSFGPWPEGFMYAENIDAVEAMIDDETVAVMIELIQGEGGVQPLEREKVQALAAALKARDILLIVDEVQTGVYRTGEFLASNLYDISPDVITLAKGIGGGVPIGVVMTSRKEIFKAGDHGSTFGGNYLSATAAKTVMQTLGAYKEKGLLDETLLYFEAALERLFAAHRDVFGEHVGFGLMRGLRVKDADTLAKIITQARGEGVLVLRSGRNTLRFLPPLTITKGEIDEGFKRLERAVATL